MRDMGFLVKDKWGPRDHGMFHVSYDNPEALVDGDRELVNSTEPIWVEFDYPLNNTYRFQIPSPVTVESLAAFVQDTYHDIYSEEDKFGIWGHDIGDLVLEGVEIHPGRIELYIGS